MSGQCTSEVVDIISGNKAKEIAISILSNEV